MKNLYIFIAIFITSLFLSSCGTVSDQCVQSSITFQDDLEHAQYLIEIQDYKQATEILQGLIKKEPDNEYAYYHLGRIQGLSGNFQQAIELYTKALEIRHTFYPAYIALRSVHKLRLTKVKEKIEETKRQIAEASLKGHGNQKDLIQKLTDIYKEQAKEYLAEAQAYLIYEDTKNNVTEFPEIEAHLRDMQDMLKELEESRMQRPQELKQIKEPLFAELKKMRSSISKKHTAMLMVLGAQFASEEDMVKAIDCLRDADAQMSKFFEEEDPTAQIQLLAQNEEVALLSRNLVEHLGRYYDKALQIHLKSRHYLTEIGEVQMAEDENRQVEQLLESTVQLRVNSLWRFSKVKKGAAEEHPDMIPLYEQLLQYITDSQKIGEYQYCLARCYAKKGDYEKALMLARKAQDRIGIYKVREFLQNVERKASKEGSDIKDKSEIKENSEIKEGLDIKDKSEENKEK